LEILKAADYMLVAFKLGWFTPPVRSTKGVVKSLGDIRSVAGEDMVVTSKFKPRIGENIR
jgi:hypothetical protein